MSGEIITVWGTSKVLEASGAAIANNALAQADDAVYDVVADGASFPHAEFVLTGTFSVAPVEGAVLALYARPLDIDGTLDADIPETTRAPVFIGTFTVNNVTTAQTLPLNGLFAYDVPRRAEYYVHNNGTGQTLAAGWKLIVTPRSRKQAV
jgi:hypothetical protein